MAKRSKTASNGDTSKRPEIADGDHWFEDAEEVSSFAYLLDGLSGFTGSIESERGDNILYYFEKPWKWTNEHVAWVAMGRPDSEALGTSRLSPIDALREGV